VATLPLGVNQFLSGRPFSFSFLFIVLFRQELAEPNTVVLAADSAGAGAPAALNATIAGRVSNAATGAYLAGAVVRVAGTGQSAITGENGAFTLQLPAGRHEISVAYTGLNAQSASVLLTAGGRAARDLKAKYFWRRSLSFYADIYNLTSDNQRERFGSGKVRFLQDRYDPQFHFGIEGRFWCPP